MVFVEGISDYQALHIIAREAGRNLDAEGVAIVELNGGGTLKTLLEIFGPTGLDLTVAGLCDADYEVDWQQRLSGAGLPVTDRQSMEAAGFFVSVQDLEDEIVSAVGTTAAQAVFANEGQAGAFHSFNSLHAGMTLHEQVRGFAQVKKTRWTPLLASEVRDGSIPTSIEALLNHV